LLARHIGPIAKVMVQKAATEAQTLADIPQMNADAMPNLPRISLVDKVAGPIRLSERLPGGPMRLRGLTGIVLFVIETHLSRRFRSDTRRPNALRR
jgi:hypothetical protein